MKQFITGNQRKNKANCYQHSPHVAKGDRIVVNGFI